MNFLLKFVLGKVSGPILVYVVLGLFVANAITGALLKKAWNDNARAAVVCKNQALRDANDRNLKTVKEMERIRIDLNLAIVEKQKAGLAAAKEIEKRLSDQETKHADAIAQVEFIKNEITDDDFFCASEPVPYPVVIGMRDNATAYNDHRNNPGAGIPPD